MIDRIRSWYLVIFKPKSGFWKTHPPRFLVGVIALFILILTALGGIFYLYDQFFYPISTKYSSCDFEIVPQATATSVSHLLEAHRLIKNSSLFILYLRLTHQDNNLRAGLYRLSPTYSMYRIIQILQEREGPASLIHITIPEGYSIKEMAQLFESHHLVASANEFESYARGEAKHFFSQKYPFIAMLPTQNIEGYLFPDTYFFSRGSSLETMFDMMIGQFDRKIYQTWKVDSSKGSLPFHKVVTLASIIEKEAGSAQDMMTVSSVFHNRLDRKIKLESCATVLFAIGEPGKDFVYLKDLGVKSAYNTYLNLGLPPTPIASVGISSFEAAIHPASTDFLYFVAKGDGTHEYSRTLSEHNHNRHLFQKNAF